MSPPWSKPLDIDRLSESEADVDFAVPLAELPRLRSQFASVEGLVSGRVHFTRESGFVVADLSMSGAATMVCQRCLKALSEPVNNTVRMALITAQADVSRVPDHLEPVLAAGGRVTIGELVEEELLLELPIVPLHAEARECVVAEEVPAVKVEAPEPTTQKPFAQLGELLKR